MWQDMGMYWAWRGKSSKDDPPPPTQKFLKYATVDTGDSQYRLAVAIYDIFPEGTWKKTPIHRDEVERLLCIGCKVDLHGEE